MSDFSGLQIALSSLYAQRRGVEVSAQNVANANTDGYSRQRVDLVNVGAPSVPAFWSTFSGAGQGVKVDTITRYRDQFMEIRAGLEHSSLASLNISKDTYDKLEQLFNEPSDVGIGNQLADFWAGFDDVANNPADASAKTQVLERAGTLVSTFNSTAQKIEQMQVDTTSELQATVVQINSDAQTMAQLNKSIKNASVAGLAVNDLMDQRDQLAQKLAELTGGTIRGGDFNEVNVYLNGTALVQEDHAGTLAVDTTNPAAIAMRWTDSNAPAAVTSGTAGGMLDAINTTLPGYLSQLDTVANQLRDDVNSMQGGLTGSIATTAQNQTATGNLQFQVALDGGAYTTVTVAGADWSGAGGAAALQTALQTAVDTAIGAGNATVAVGGGAGATLSVSLVGTTGHSLLSQAAGTNTGFATLLGTSGVGSDGIAGRQFFTGTGAKDFAVSADIAGNPGAIAAGVAGGGPLDASRALQLAEMATSTTGADSKYHTLIVQLGVDSQAAQRRQAIQSTSATSLDDARSGQSGVSIDEEMTNLVQYQHAYDASAKLMSVIDEMLDTLINHTGL